MQIPEVKISPWLQEGFNLYKENLGVLILGGLIAVLLTVATIGILGGPMGAGMVFIVLALLGRQDPKPKAGDVFKGFGYFADAFLFVALLILVSLLGSFLLGTIPVLGMILSFVFGWVLHAFVMFSLFLIVDQRMGFWPATLKSIEVVLSNPGPFVGFGVVAAIIGSLGAVACGIGVVVTYPLQVCILAVAYRDIFGTAGADQSFSSAPTPSSPPSEPPPPPPPPPSATEPPPPPPPDSTPSE